MNACPYAHESATCGLLSQEIDETAANCNHCSQLAFQCAAGHWNRAFARYCTQCGMSLEKPAVWDMASGNPQRTGILPQMPSHNGFGSWVAKIPEIESDENLPGLLAIDGLIIVPNPSQNRLDAYTITKPQDGRSLNHQWSIEFNTPLTHGSTPIYHGLHLYSVVSGGIQKTDIIRGTTELIDINGIDVSLIEPIPGCAPLKCDVNGSPMMIAGLKERMLLFNLKNNDGVYFTNHNFFAAENRPMSPTGCGPRVVFTSQSGQILSLNIGEEVGKLQRSSWDNLSFSAPVTLGNCVYIEAMNRTGKRYLSCYQPESDELSPVADLDTDNNFNRRLSLFLHSTLTDGESLFLADRFGRAVYTYHCRYQTCLPPKELTASGNHISMFVPHRSIVVNNRIYVAHPAGLTVLNIDQNYLASYQSLAMGQNDNPVPVAPPIRYGGNLFVLCKDRIVCLTF